MVFSQQFLQTICYFKRVDSYIVGIIVDFLITVVIITSPASLILQKRLRRRDSITSDITSLVIGNHTDCTVNMVFNMYAGLQKIQVWTIKDDRIFTITYEADEEDFQNDLLVAERMI